MAEAPDDSIEKTASNSPLDKAGDFAKYLTALSTGALVFSADLLKKDYVLPGISRHLVLGSWICLALSALFGLAALARIPMMMVEQSQDLGDFFLKWPLRGQQVLLSFGVVTLGIAMVLALWHTQPPSTDEQKPPQAEKSMSHERYTIVSSAQHSLGKSLAHYHTFLLDRDTGRVWDMTCDSNNNVRFRTVKVEDLPTK